MPLAAPRFAVLLAEPTDDDPNATLERVVTVLHGDQLRAELEGPKHGHKDISLAPMHYTTMWVWAALTREGVVSEKFSAFKGRVLTMESIEDERPDPTQPPVDTDSD